LRYSKIDPKKIAAIVEEIRAKAVKLINMERNSVAPTEIIKIVEMYVRMSVMNKEGDQIGEIIIPEDTYSGETAILIATSLVTIITDKNLSNNELEVLFMALRKEFAKIKRVKPSEGSN